MDEYKRIPIKIYQKKMLFLVFFAFCSVMLLLLFRTGYFMFFKADDYQKRADELHQREREIKGKRGKILDRNGKILAENQSVSQISVIHSQIEDEEAVIKLLVKELKLDEKIVRKKVTKLSIREKIKTNVDKKTSDRIRAVSMAGIMVDEDYKRYYPENSLGSKVLGFTGNDNQGILGLESKYDSLLMAGKGAILTTTTAKGVEIENGSELRKEPEDGKDLQTTLDINVMKYAHQTAHKLLEEKQCKGVDILIMNPSNGDIYAMVSAPEFDLNQPFTVLPEYQAEGKTEDEHRNAMWRNRCISDTYEPGSTFKVLTMASALEEKAVTMEDHFFCPGYITVEDRRIRCHKTTGHGSESFVEGVMNSCNPVFISLGLRVGKEKLFQDFKKFGLFEKTGIDLPGEAGTIMHKIENVGAVELATVSFGQSFQVSPIRLLTCISTIVNGGNKITPHIGVTQHSSNTNTGEEKASEKVLSSDTVQKVRGALTKVVSEGTGKKAGVEGYQVGGKTGTSEKLPRHTGKYIASCMGFAPSYNPKVAVLVRIDEPKGLYYGGTVAAPVVGDILKNILPYLVG